MSSDLKVIFINNTKECRPIQFSHLMYFPSVKYNFSKIFVESFCDISRLWWEVIRHKNNERKPVILFSIYKCICISVINMKSLFSR